MSRKMSLSAEHVQAVFCGAGNLKRTKSLKDYV